MRLKFRIIVKEDETSEKFSASVSAISARDLTFLSPSCRCLTVIGGRFPEILLTMFHTFLRDVRLLMEETKRMIDVWLFL